MNPPDIEHPLTVIAGQSLRILITLKDAEGTPLPADHAAIRGSASDYLGTRHPMASERFDEHTVLLAVPPLPAGRYRYDIFALREDGISPLICEGNLSSRERITAPVGEEHTSGEHIIATISAPENLIAVTVEEITAISEADWASIRTCADRAEQAAGKAEATLPALEREIAAARSTIEQEADQAARHAAAETAALIAATGEQAQASVLEEASRATSAALESISTAEATAINQATNNGITAIGQSITAGTGTIAAAVTSGKASIDSYVSTTSADLARKSQPNIWSGVQTFNAPVVINDSATLTKATYAPSALVNCDAMLALTYVAQAIQCGYYSAFDATSDSLNTLAFTGVTVTPAATAYAVRPMYGQGHGDLNNRYVTIRVEYGDNMCVHFGGGRNSPAGTVRMQAPYILHTDLPPGSDSPYYDHEPQYFAVVGKGYCANAQPVLILYHRATDEILYAEALMPAARSCTISTHYLGGVAGKYYDQIYDIYSGRTGYVDTSTRTRITLVGRGKFQMTGGGAVVSSVPNNAGRACVRTWPMVAPSEAQVAVIRAHTLAAAYSSVRTKPVTCDLPDTCAVAAEGGVINGTATSVNAWPADYLAAYVVRLADWVSIRTVSDATQSSPAVTRIIGSGTITLTVSPNTTGAPRSACVLVGAPSCPARIITITQSAS